MSDGRKQFKQGLAANYGNIAQKSGDKAFALTGDVAQKNKQCAERKH